MGLNLNSVYQKPYVVKDGRNLVRRQQDDESAKKATQAEQEERANSQARSKGLQYVEESRLNIQRLIIMLLRLNLRELNTFMDSTLNLQEHLLCRNLLQCQVVCLVLQVLI